MTFRTAAAAAAFALVAACSRGDAKKAAAPRAVAVRAARAVEKDVPVEVRAVGRIVANQSVAVRAQVSGPIVAVHFTEGQQVKKGDLLLEIDRRPYASALAEARAKLAQDRARDENARADAKRYAELVEKEYVTRQQYEAARAIAAALDATLTADEAAVERAALDLSYCTIRAPASGRTGRLLVHAGNLVSANAPEPLVTIEQVRPVFAAFSIPERHLGALRGRALGLQVRVRPAGADRDVPGTLAFVDNAVDPTTGTILLKARVENEDEALWPGQVVDVFLRIGERSRAIVVPASAVASGQQGDYAYVVSDERKAQLRPVVVAQAGDEEAVISQGITAGELVVTEGQLKLRPDAPVELLDERGKPQGGGGEAAAKGGDR
ncbi:MAG TPA: efflux RND transporter periplasmic adaptor subunit [Anaeromyxobacter sp.]|nr:efflux RND transporter periplasmic adaptor subunit [Anaeromyxobacter sp.]